MPRLLFAIAAALVAIGASTARSADVLDGSAFHADGENYISELRLGVFAHDPTSREKDGLADLNAEVLFVKPWGSKLDWWMPRPHIGTTLDFVGKTSIIYAGATWQYEIFDTVLLEATFGGSVNDGRSKATESMSGLGCPVLFRESLSLGYRFSPNWSLIATVEHNSNAGLCDGNRGLTNEGIRLGYRF